ncbi:MAG: outer membrane lipoprotein-sorting protein [Methanosarcinaceae archaeon]|nr:outer membrane lipoprotein-sorting protein [Methanosarcinaceae archaeon]
MTAKKTLFVLCFITLALFGSGCQENLSAEEIATKIQEKTEEIEDCSYTMQITTYHEGKKIRESEMQIMYKLPNLMKTYGKEGGEEVEVITDGEFIWSYTPKTNTVTKVKLPPPKTEEIPELNYLAFVEHFQNKSEISLLGTEAIDGRSAYLLETTPKGEKKGLQGKKKVWVDKETWISTRIEIYDYKESLVSEVELKDLKINTGIPDSEFIFKLPEGAKVKNLDLEKDFEVPEKLSLAEAKAKASFEILLPEYLPEGYVFNHSMVTNNSWIAPEGQGIESVILTYENEEKASISLSESVYEEKARKAQGIALAENISVKGKEGKYMEVFGDLKVLKWNIGEVELTISTSDLEKAELLKLAESIK